ncbi:cytochrome ubiquinol oxidase subunit I [Shumkonia mesophila]|uniref:cytochrome ubiquinol oxidase subunit I n=1 Tax=Shumkonia mesophila TaxID=2838854 RepID=UPI002934C503|nr:cytochrome ubiquinol oxidase subunit I [Shumkonia mesophila]
MEFDALTLARIQFAFTVSFHIVFPAFTIGLASYLAVLEGLWLWRRGDVYLHLYRYWSKIFAITFGMGVVSGIVMSYQFGTNWGPFSDAAGPVIGPLLGYEVLSAFFLEAGFLGVMLFGMNRVGRGLHFFATLMVAAGTLFSAFWILAANSWMQTPTGAGFDGLQFTPDDWWTVIFNPSFPFRFVHMVLAAYLTTALIVGAVGAWHLLRISSDPAARVMVSMAMWMAALVAPLQLLAGDLHGLNTLEHQPAKIAAMEGHWEKQRGAPLLLFGIPDMGREETRYALSIPRLGSLILTHDWNGEVPGLLEWPPEDRPNSAVVFWSFRTMVGLGIAMIALGLASLALRRRGRLYSARWFLRLAVVMGPSGLVAVIAGWITTEVGRQPWVVYGMMRTSEGVSPVAAPAVASSLALFAVVYFAVFGAGVYYLLQLMHRPAGADDAGRPPGAPERAAGITPAPSIGREEAEAPQ